MLDCSTKTRPDNIVKATSKFYYLQYAMYYLWLCCNITTINGFWDICIIPSPFPTTKTFVCFTQFSGSCRNHVNILYQTVNSWNVINVWWNLSRNISDCKCSIIWPSCMSLVNAFEACCILCFHILDNTPGRHLIQNTTTFCSDENLISSRYSGFKIQSPWNLPPAWSQKNVWNCYFSMDFQNVMFYRKLSLRCYLTYIICCLIWTP